MNPARNVPVPPPPAFDASLWSRLEAMQLDAPGASLTFTKRLARENGWSPSRARDVVAEYRRFLYLAARAGHPVTPSDAVDQAWHLHLVYTRHYWGVLCPDVLGFELHHGPTLGGAREQSKFGDWYERTLESYRATFGEPPAGIWPGVPDRFEGVERMQRIDRGASWLIPKPSLRRCAALLRPTPVGLGLLLLAAGLLLGDSSAASRGTARGTVEANVGSAIFVILLLMVLFPLIAYFFGASADQNHDSKKEKDDGRKGSGGCGGDGGAGCGGGGCGGCGG